MGGVTSSQGDLTHITQSQPCSPSYPTFSHQPSELGDLPSPPHPTPSFTDRSWNYSLNSRLSPADGPSQVHCQTPPGDRKTLGASAPSIFPEVFHFFANKVICFTTHFNIPDTCHKARAGPICLLFKCAIPQRGPPGIVIDRSSTRPAGLLNRSHNLPGAWFPSPSEA